MTLGLMLSLGTVSISCVDKDGDTGDTVTASNSDSQGPDSNGDVSDSHGYPDGVTYAGPDESSVSDPYATTTSNGSDPSTTNDSFPDGSTYAGPDENSTTTGAESSGSTGADTEGSSGSSGGDTEAGSSSTTAPDTTDTNGEGATYAGPDDTF